MNNTHIKFNLFLVLLVIFIAGCQKHKQIKLPFNTDKVWIYKKIQGHLSSLNIPSDIDTIRVRVLEVKYLESNIKLISFSENIFRFWDFGIIETDSGYWSNLAPTYNNPLIISNPFYKGKKWVNTFARVYEECEIIGVNRRMKFGDVLYDGCIEIKIARKIEGDPHNVTVVMNETHGILYYRDEQFQEEIILLEMVADK